MIASKYHAIPTEVDGIRFASKKEAARYQELRLLERGKVIQELRLQQPIFDLTVNGVHICKYRPDFSYIEDGKRVIEDTKGFKTPAYVIKRKLMKAIHNVEIKEV